MGEAEQKFNDAWLHLARAGKVDDVYGAEYRRVFFEWQIHEQPEDVLDFILASVDTTLDRREVNTGDSDLRNGQ